MRLLLTASFALLAACTESPEKPTAEPVASASPAVARSSPSPAPTAADAEPATAIEGEYRIAGVNGQDINQPYAITASISSGRIHVTADCINLGWDYTLEGAAISTKRVAVEGCGRGMTAAEEAITTAFDAARTVVRTPSNSIEFRAPGHTVTLFSQ
jgi:hypothetical protein